MQLLVGVAETADGHRAAMGDCLEWNGFAVLKSARPVPPRFAFPIPSGSPFV